MVNFVYLLSYYGEYVLKMFLRTFLKCVIQINVYTLEVFFTFYYFYHIGARRSGFQGFFKGIGKGLIGLLVKPTGGVIDLVTSSLDGVRRYIYIHTISIIENIRLKMIQWKSALRLIHG